MSDPPEPTVYIVDDDVSALRSVSRMLRASGYQVVIHNSATEFLEELQADMNGCLITDLMMPEMSGIELQDAIQASGNTIPIIFLTGHGDIPTSVRAMRSGAEDFLTKNAPKRDLIAAVDRALDHNARQRKEAAHLEELRRPFTLLSEREREVLQHVLQAELLVGREAARADDHAAFLFVQVCVIHQ